jgi:RecA/RadA recombinase
MAKETTKLSMADFAKKLNREYDNSNLMITSNIIPAYRRLDSGLFGMTYGLGGGLPYGRLAVYAGLEHSGKTTAACAELAAYMRHNPTKQCVFVDVEHSLDLQFQALMHGIDLSRLFYFNPENMSGEQILEAILEMEDTEDIGMIILDSAPAMMPASNLENEFTKDNGMRGNMAKAFHKFCPVMCDKLAKNGNIMIIINQVRIAGYSYTGAPLYKEPVGSSLSYYASVKIRFGTRVFLKDGEEIKGTDGEGATGFRLKAKVTKNKTFSTSRGGLFASFNYETGAEYLNDMLAVALQFDFIKRLNNVTYALVNLDTGEILVDPETGEELKNKKAYLINYLKEHPAFMQTYAQMLSRHMAAANDISLLDKDTLAEIDAQESAVSEENQAKGRQVLVE